MATNDSLGKKCTPRTARLTGLVFLVGTAALLPPVVVAEGREPALSGTPYLPAARSVEPDGFTLDELRATLRTPDGRYVDLGRFPRLRRDR